MKAFLLTAAFLVGGFAHAQVRGYKCLGTTTSGDVVMIKGAVNQASMSHSGDLLILGTDSEPSDNPNSFLGGSATDPRFFPGNQITVDFDADQLSLTLEGFTDNQSTVKMRYAEGDESSFFKTDLKENTVKGFGPYKHTFRRASCKFKNGAFARNDWSFNYPYKPPQWPY